MNPTLPYSPDILFSVTALVLLAALIALVVTVIVICWKILRKLSEPHDVKGETSSY
ncbi:hypothetical protein ACTOVQ_02000 [Arcanobacterium canis]